MYAGIAVIFRFTPQPASEGLAAVPLHPFQPFKCAIETSLDRVLLAYYLPQPLHSQSTSTAMSCRRVRRRRVRTTASGFTSNAPARNAAKVVTNPTLAARRTSSVTDTLVAQQKATAVAAQHPGAQWSRGSVSERTEPRRPASQLTPLTNDAFLTAASSRPQ